ncbi:MAG: hypothetical protein R6V02_03210 [Candidatus Aminicenantes bacterium]
MRTMRKVIGLIIIILFGLPSLIGVIWTVGMTRASVSPAFLSDMPQEIIREVPHLVEEIFEEAQDEDAIRDENIRNWFRAASQADISPTGLLDEIGLLDWMQNEISQSLQDIGDVMRGKKRIRPVQFDLRPFKKALYHPLLEEYTLQLFQNFPPCDEYGLKKWQAVAEGGDWIEAPACRPDMNTVRIVLQYKRDEVVREMPDEVEVFSGIRYVPFGAVRFITMLSYFFFFVPALFILGGAAVAADSFGTFLRWTGLSVLAGGLIALGLAFFVKNFAMLGIGLAPLTQPDYWTSDLQGLILEKTRWIPMMVMDKLFSPVMMVAGVASVCGLVLFAFGLIARGGRRSQPSGEEDIKSEEENQTE